MAYLTGGQIKPEGNPGGTCWHRGATPPCWRTRLQPLPRPRSRHPLLRLLNGVLDVVDVGDDGGPGVPGGLRGLHGLRPQGGPRFRNGLLQHFRVHPLGLAAQGGWDGGCWGFSVCASFDQRLQPPDLQPQRPLWGEEPLVGSVRVELIELPGIMKNK